MNVLNIALVFVRLKPGRFGLLGIRSLHSILYLQGIDRDCRKVGLTTSAMEVMYVITVCWFVCLSAGLHRNYLVDFHETCWRDVAWAKEEPIRYWSESEGPLPGVSFHFLWYLALAEVCALRSSNGF